MTTATHIYLDIHIVRVRLHKAVDDILGRSMLGRRAQIRAMLDPNGGRRLVAMAILEEYPRLRDGSIGVPPIIALGCDKDRYTKRGLVRNKFRCVKASMGIACPCSGKRYLEKAPRSSKKKRSHVRSLCLKELLGMVSNSDWRRYCNCECHYRFGM